MDIIEKDTVERLKAVINKNNGVTKVPQFLTLLRKSIDQWYDFRTGKGGLKSNQVLDSDICELYGNDCNSCPINAIFGIKDLNQNGCDALGIFELSKFLRWDKEWFVLPYENDPYYEEVLWRADDTLTHLRAALYFVTEGRLE